MSGLKEVALRGFVAAALILAPPAAQTARAASHALAISVTASSVQDSGCRILFDAQDRLNTAPNHSYMTEIRSAKGKSMASESVFAGGVRYIKVNNKWMKSPLSLQDEQKRQQENRQRANEYSCRYMREESVQGESAVVYSAHQKNEDFTVDAQIWISKSRGLILREEEDMDVGGGAMGKSHISVRYEYSHVRAPEISH